MPEPDSRNLFAAPRARRAAPDPAETLDPSPSVEPEVNGPKTQPGASRAAFDPAESAGLRPVDESEQSGPQAQPVASTAIPEPLKSARRTAAELWRAFLRPGKGQLVVAVILALTTTLILLTVRTQAARPDYSNLRRTDLIQLLDNLSAETRRLESEIREQQTTRDELQSGVRGAEVAKAEAQRRLEQIQIIGGTVPASGKGIRIMIADPQQKLTPELLLNALEELRDAGAEVIEFDDKVRVVASTWLGRDDKGRIVADGQVLKFPLQIEAIGDPATLEAGARFRGGLVSTVEGARVGGSVTITQLDRVVINSVITPKVNEYARPK